MITLLYIGIKKNTHWMPPNYRNIFEHNLTLASNVAAWPLRRTHSQRHWFVIGCPSSFLVLIEDCDFLDIEKLAACDLGSLARVTRGLEMVALLVNSNASQEDPMTDIKLYCHPF